MNFNCSIKENSLSFSSRHIGKDNDTRFSFQFRNSQLRRLEILNTNLKTDASRFSVTLANFEHKRLRDSLRSLLHLTNFTTQVKCKAFNEVSEIFDR